MLDPRSQLPIMASKQRPMATSSYYYFNCYIHKRKAPTLNISSFELPIEMIEQLLVCEIEKERKMAVSL